MVTIEWRRAETDRKDKEWKRKDKEWRGKARSGDHGEEWKVNRS